MAVINKPVDINKIWSASGDILAPSDTKISQGWAVEIPPRQYFNYIDNKQDQAIAHINQRGIALWDNTTEYQANGSYVQGSDGNIYKCLITATNVNPVGDTTGTWQSAFVTTASATQVATAAQARAQTVNNVFLSPLQLANAFTGTNQGLSPNGWQKLPGGLILQWGTFSTGNVAPLGQASVVVTLPMSLSTVYAANATDGANAQLVCGVSLTSNSQVTITQRNVTNASVVAGGGFYFVVGV